MNPNSVIMQAISLQFTNLDDSFLAVDAQSGYCYSLNATALKIWTLAKSPIAFSGLCSLLREEFNVDDESCRSEVASFVSQMRDAGLIKVIDEANPVGSR